MNLAKRLFAVLLALAMVFSFAACGEKKEEAPVAEEPTWTPEKTITCIIGYAAGGTSDILGRELAAQLQDYFHVPVDCVNVTGGGSSIAGRQVLDAPADGYTIFSAVAHTPSAWAVSDYDDMFCTDFYCITTGTSPYLVAVAKDSPWNTIEDMVKDIQAAPNQYKYGSAGLGSIGQLAAVFFNEGFNLVTQHIGYSGGRESILKVMSHDVDYMVAGYSDIADLVLAGEVKSLGFITSEDVELALPTGTIKSPGLVAKYPKELEGASSLSSIWGLFIPRTCPPEVVKAYQEAVAYAMEQPAFQESFTSRQLSLMYKQGEESDELLSRIESLFAWGLYDTGVATKSPELFGIPKPEDFKYPSTDRAKAMNPWP